MEMRSAKTYFSGIDIHSQRMFTRGEACQSIGECADQCTYSSQRVQRAVIIREARWKIRANYCASADKRICATPSANNQRAGHAPDRSAEAVGYLRGGPH